MNDFKKIADFLLQNNNYYIIVHKNPDGDCLGSAKAICLALKAIGKSAKVCLPNSVSDRLSFMWDDSLTEVSFTMDVAFPVDVASFDQMGDLYDGIFKNATNSVCVDHHGTNDGYADINLIDENAAATGELIYELIREMGIEITEDMASALLVSIADDTGCFQYSNTSAKTHTIVSELYKIIPNPEPILRALYAKHTKNEIEVLKAIIPNFEYYLDGKVCLVTADVKKIEALGADRSNIDAWVSLPRSIEGVEVSAVIKVISDSEIKVSLRSNDYVDVSALAASFGGGGHVRAAGVTFFESADTVKKMLLDELKKVI